MTPLVLVAALLPFEFPLHLAYAVTAVTMRWVEWLSGLDMALWRCHAVAAMWLALAAVVGMMILLPQRGTPGRLVCSSSLPLWWPGSALVRKRAHSG